MRFFAPRGHFTGRFHIEIGLHFSPGEVIAAAERQICIRSSQNRMFHPDLLCFHQFRGRFLDPQLAIPIHDSPSMDNEQRSTSNSNMQWHNGFGCRWASSLSVNTDPKSMPRETVCVTSCQTQCLVESTEHPSRLFCIGVREVSDHRDSVADLSYSINGSENFSRLTYQPNSFFISLWPSCVYLF